MAFDYPHYPITREQGLEAADGWDELAQVEEDRLTWDRQALPSMVASKAALYRATAKSIREKYNLEPV